MAVLLLAGMLILVGGAITIAAAKDAKEKNTMKSRQYYDKEKARHMAETPNNYEEEIESENECDMSYENCTEKPSILKFVLIFVALVFVLFLISVLFDLYTFSPTTNVPNNQSTKSIETENIFENEIKYRGYEWGANIVTLANDFDDPYFASYTPTWSQADELLSFSDYQLGYALSSYGDQETAGYPISIFGMYCMYGYNNGEFSTSPEDSELYLVTMRFDVVDVEGTYKDLQLKLNSTYGEGKTSHSTGSAISTDAGYYKYSVEKTEWRGQNNTGIVLTMHVPYDDAPDSVDLYDKYVILSYGKTDSEATLSARYKDYKNYLTEVEANNRDTTNTSGL